MFPITEISNFTVSYQTVKSALYLIQCTHNPKAATCFIDIRFYVQATRVIVKLNTCYQLRPAVPTFFHWKNVWLSFRVEEGLLERTWNINTNIESQLFPSVIIICVQTCLFVEFQMHSFGCAW